MSSESSFVNRRTELPRCTSQWTDDDLETLQIAVVQSRAYTPRELLSCIVNESIERRAARIKDHLRKYMPPGLALIDFDDFYSVQHNKCRSILYNSQKLPMSYRFRVEPLQEFAEDAWRQSFQVHGELFCQQLIYMSWLRETGHTITDHMFLQLFQHFTAMFGLHSISASCQPPHTSTLCGMEVSSSPDLTFYDLPSCDKDNTKLFAVCRVQRGSECNDIPLQPSSKRLHAERQREITHLDAEVIGQHGGDLLVHYTSRSSKQQGILGLIVQRTNVTFSEFSCTAMDYEALTQGAPSYPEGTGPKMKFSKPYNILRTEDRIHLIEPLLKLGFLQCAL
ncbi:uncharacterized protein [Magallana gigas]|uniref:uncharacterized protein n=1 Tax=Magallana gigas TaxID=29159 RepID=UPI003340598D